MDGKGSYLDNIFIERLWRSLKHEDTCIKACASVQKARRGIGGWLTFYNDRRLHQARSYRAPREVIQAPGSPPARQGFDRCKKSVITSLPLGPAGGNSNWRETILTHLDSCPMNGVHPSAQISSSKAAENRRPHPSGLIH
jgi:hypothetical protein